MRGKIAGLVLSALVVSGLSTTAGEAQQTRAGEAQVRKIAILIKNTTASTPNNQRASFGVRAVGTRLRGLGYEFLQLAPDGKCRTSDRQITEIEIGQAAAALACLDSVALGAEIVTLYYAGPLAIQNGQQVLPVPAADLQQGSATPQVTPTPATAPAPAPILVRDLLPASRSGANTIGVVILDALEPAADQPEALAQSRIVRIPTGSARRLIAFPAPAGEAPEPGNATQSAYTGRLLQALDAEFAAFRSGRPLRDIREVFRDPELTSSKAWPGRSSEVLIEGLGRAQITLAGRSPDAAGLAEKLPTAADRAAAAKVDCGRDYREIVRSGNCQRLFDFQNLCRQPVFANVVDTALRLRCVDALVEKKQQAMKGAFEKLQKNPTCAMMGAFTEQYAQDFDLVDAPEIDAANGLKTKVCVQEARQKELAELESGLRAVITENTCAAFKAYESRSASKLSEEQAGRLGTALKTRCGYEDNARVALRACLERNESQGNFCGSASCFQGYRIAMPGDANFAPHKAENERREKICRESMAMQACFAADECGGERCSLPLRLAVANGAFIGHIEQHERLAKQRCDAKRQVSFAAKQDAERAQRERQEAAEAEAKREATFRFTLCNNSSKGTIWAAIMYYDYREKQWIVEGWWSIDGGACHYIGEHFQRGSVYIYAHSRGDRYVWRGTHGLCVQQQRFRRVNSAQITCPSDRHRLFKTFTVNQPDYKHNFVD